jgi:TRAP-type C4-dicarboxylate transport system permease small subunit
LIEVVCGLVVEIMRRRFANSDSKIHRDYYLFWTILLYTVGLKSIAQTVETVSPNFAQPAFYITIFIVIAGLLAAAIISPRIIANYTRSDHKLGRGDVLALVSLLLTYLGLAVLPEYFLAK